MPVFNSAGGLRCSVGRYAGTRFVQHTRRDAPPDRRGSTPGQPGSPPLGSDHFTAIHAVNTKRRPTGEDKANTPATFFRVGWVFHCEVQRECLLRPHPDITFQSRERCAKSLQANKGIKTQISSTGASARCGGEHSSLSARREKTPNRFLQMSKTAMNGELSCQAESRIRK